MATALIHMKFDKFAISSNLPTSSNEGNVWSVQIKVASHSCTKFQKQNKAKCTGCMDEAPNVNQTNKVMHTKTGAKKLLDIQAKRIFPTSFVESFCYTWVFYSFTDYIPRN